MHRIVGEVRVGDVALHAVHGELARQRAAAADLDHVAERIGARRLADDAPVDLLAARLEHFHDAARAVDRRAFLVAGQQERQRAGVVGMPGDEALGRSDHRGQTALHVGGAAAVQHAVAYDRLERVGLPFLARAGRYDVGMTGEAQHRAAIAMARPEVLDRTERHALDPEARPLAAAAPISCRHPWSSGLTEGRRISSWVEGEGRRQRRSVDKGAAPKAAGRGRRQGRGLITKRAAERQARRLRLHDGLRDGAPGSATCSLKSISCNTNVIEAGRLRATRSVRLPLDHLRQRGSSP